MCEARGDRLLEHEGLVDEQRVHLAGQGGGVRDTVIGEEQLECPWAEAVLWIRAKRVEDDAGDGNRLVAGKVHAVSERSVGKEHE